MLTDAEWPLRDKFLAALRSKLAAMPNRVAYYPGSNKKHAGARVPICWQRCLFCLFVQSQWATVGSLLDGGCSCFA